MTEDILQAQCFTWFHNSYPIHRKKLWHVPNGGSRHKIEAMKLKAIGVVSGVHDLHFLYKNKFYTFELKVGENKLTDEQIKFWLAIESEGAICFEVRSLEHFKSIIQNIIQ